MTTKTLAPPEIGELVGLHAQARTTGNFTHVYQRLAELHHDGYSWRVLGNALGILPNAAQRMAQHATLDQP